LASEPPQFMLKYVDSTVLSAAFVCLVTLYASERAVSGYQYLGGLHVKQDYTSSRGSIRCFRIL
jgi:hypothetical protein